MADGRQTIKDLFAAWLVNNAPSAHLSELYLCYSEIEEFCLRIKVLHKPLFETTDVDTVKKVQKTIMENRLFKSLHKKRMKKIVSAAQYYTAFVKSLTAENDKTETTKETEKETSGSTTLNEINTAEQDEIKPAEIEECNPYTIDFHQRVNLAYTRPVKVSYFDDELCVGASWTDVYVKLMEVLYEDYADDIPIGESFTGMERIDLGNSEHAKSMTAPKQISTDMYLETNLSATDIVCKIKALLDICRVDYENVVIKYERKDYIAHAVKKSKKSQRIGTSEVSGNAPGESTFYSYLHDSLGMAEATCRSYVSSIRSMEKFAAENHITSTRLYNCPAEEASTTVRLLFNDVDFLKYNEQQHNRFRAAINKMLAYMGCNTIESRVAQSTFVVQTTPDVSCTNYDTTPFEYVLEQRFVKGFRFGSAIEMRKFKRYYEEMNEVPLDKDDSTIEGIIRSCSIEYENKAFLPKTMLSEEVKERLLSYINSTFELGKTSIYFEALFQEFSECFLDSYIYNADMLRSYLVFECGNKYVIGKNQFSKEVGVTVDPIDEVRNCLKEYGKPMEIDKLCAILAHLPRNNVVQILGSNHEFVRNRKGEYFHADILALSEEELDNIAELIEESIESHKFTSGTELINAIKAKYPRTYDEYSSYSDIGWRDALKYKYGNRFSFNGNIISNNGENLSMSDVFGQLASGADVITVDELLAFAKEIGTNIYFDAVYENALRINEETFVSKDRAAFNVKETDDVIDRICTGNYVPLSSFREFGIFPDAGFPWTVYLIESYAAFYSERYTLIHGGYNRNCAVGAVVKKNAGYESFDDLIVDVIADSDIPMEKADALDFLVNSGYIARRTYAGIEELLIRANAQRNRKGRS